MKKKIFLLLTVLFCLGAALTLTACGGDPAPEHTHIYGEWIETTAPTCTTQGIKTHVCDCGHSETQDVDIDPNAHAPATWTTDGTNHWKDCTACGYNIDPAAAHTYDAENTCVCGDYKDKGVQFTLSNGTYKVSDYTGTATEVVIPATYKGIAVTSIGFQAFYDCDGLTTITIPDSVTSIGNYAFDGCSQLTTVTFGANSKLTSIGYEAFYNCPNLTIITIPEGVTSIGACAFYKCSQLTTVEFGANSKLTSIGKYAFYSCNSLTTITIPSGVTSIGNLAFIGCSQLTTVEFGANSKLTSIGKYAFHSCDSLTTVYYGGSASDWEKITIGDRNTDFTSATRYYYSATEPTTAGNWWYYDQNGKPAVWGK